MENKKLQDLLKEKASTHLTAHGTGRETMNSETGAESMCLDSTNQRTNSIPIHHETEEVEEPKDVELSVETFKPLQLTQYSGVELIKQIRVSYGCEAKVFFLFYRSNVLNFMIGNAIYTVGYGKY